jgi:hypothetical protein
MWRTTQGERTLAGAEAMLVRKSLAAIYDVLETDCIPRNEAFDSGVDLFDRLSAEQQLSMLAVVGEALLCEHVQPPPLNALTEATAAAIFGGLQAKLEAELDADQASQEQQNVPTASTIWRSRLRAAAAEGDGRHDRLPAPTSIDWEHWNALVEEVSARVLGIDDWNMEELVVDSNPDQSAIMKDGLDIKLDYFDAIAPDPMGGQLRAVRQRLDALTGLRHADAYPDSA